MSTYVRAARRLPATHRRFYRVTGDVLHLAVFAPERPEDGLFPGGRWVPVCNPSRTVDHWAITGPWAEGWKGHAGQPLCRRCVLALERLAADAAGQVLRARNGRGTVVLPPPDEGPASRKEPT